MINGGMQEIISKLESLGEFQYIGGAGSGGVSSDLATQSEIWTFSSEGISVAELGLEIVSKIENEIRAFNGQVLESSALARTKETQGTRIAYSIVRSRGTILIELIKVPADAPFVYLRVELVQWN